MAIPDPVLRGGAWVGQAVDRVADHRAFMGPGGDFWERVRTGALPVAERLLGDEVMASVPVDEREFVGTLPCGREEAEEALWEAGFRRNPLSALKTRDGETEIGSWAYRDGPDSRRQLHVALFESEADDGVDVYAHEEYSSINPDVAPDHYHAEGQRKALGGLTARALLPLEIEAEHRHLASLYVEAQEEVEQVDEPLPPVLDEVCDTDPFVCEPVVLGREDSATTSGESLIDLLEEELDVDPGRPPEPESESESESEGESADGEAVADRLADLLARRRDAGAEDEAEADDRAVEEDEADRDPT